MEQLNTMIAPSFLHAEMREELLKESSGYINTDILSMSSYLIRGCRSSVDETELLLNIYHTILKNRDHLKALYQSAQYAFFAREILSFLKDTASFGIDVSALPESTTIQKELKYLLLQMQKFPLMQKEERNYLQNLSDAHSVSLMPYPFFSPLEKMQYELLQAKGAKLLSPKKEEIQNVICYIAQNKRQEAEALAQYIISHDAPLDDYRIILGDTSYLSTLKRVFERYGIPCYTTLSRRTPPLLNRFISLCRYMENRNPDTFLELLLHQGLNSMPALLEMQKFSRYESFTDFSRKETKTENRDLKELYEKAKKEYEDHLEEIRLIETDTRSMEEILRISFHLITSHISTDSETAVCKKIKETIDSYFSLVSNMEEMQLLLSSIQLQEKGQENGIRICDIRHAYTLSPKITIVLGSANLPDFRFYNGIFDEDYYALLPYPTKEERYDLIEQATVETLKHSRELIVSFPIADYSGKSVNLNAFWEDFLNSYPAERVTWPLKEGGSLLNPSHRLRPDFARDVFLNQGSITGSISSFEKYFSCPYSYYLNSGLHLKKKEYIIGPAEVGSVLHSIMEHLLNTYGKEYCTQKKEVILAEIEASFAPLYASYPTLHPYINNLKLRLESHLFASLDALKRMESVSPYTPKAAELRFARDLDTDPPIRLRGIVDRVDESQKGYRVIDYKSGSKTLDAGHIRAGLSLQLLTYLIILQKETTLSPHGTYYFSFTDQSLEVTAGKFSLTTNLTTFYDGMDWREDYDNSHKLVGVSFTELPENLKDYVKSMKNASYTEFKDIIMKLYQYVAEQLMRGNIAPLPVENACKYCDYKGICHYYEDPLKVKDADIIKRIEDAHEVQ